MTEHIDCTALRENPELFRIVLQNAVEEIAGGISDECTITPFAEQEEPDIFLQKQEQNLQSVLKTIVHPLLNNTWKELEISRKVSFIHQLESKYPTDFVAWRPTAGEIPILALRGHYLTDKKERLLFKIRKCEAKGGELKKTLYTKASALRNSLKKISIAEEHLLNLCNDYERITRDVSSFANY